MAKDKLKRPLFGDDSQYVAMFFGGMLALWVASWVSNLIPVKLFVAHVDVLNLVTLIVTLGVFLGVMVPYARLIGMGGLRVTGSMLMVSTLVAGLFAYVFLATIGQIYNDSSFSASDAAIVKLAVAGIFGIFYAVGWWCGVHYDLLVIQRRSH